MNKDMEFYINEDGIACVPLKYYNDSLEKIERISFELERQSIEIERLHSIIKEAIEYINKTEMGEGYKKMLLEILDKENKEWLKK